MTAGGWFFLIPTARVKIFSIIYCGFLMASSLLVCSCGATGKIVLTGTARDPISPDQVTVFYEPPIDVDYEVIGLVEAQITTSQRYYDRDFPQGVTLPWESVSPAKAYNLLFDELRKQAAKVGANGVISNGPEYRTESDHPEWVGGSVTGIGSWSSDSGSETDIMEIKGTAIIFLSDTPPEN
jgi:hypothetical protein